MIDLKKAVRIFIISWIAALLAAVVFIILVYRGAFGELRNRKALKDYENAIASVVLSDEGEMIGRYFSQNRTNISFEKIPQHLHDALLATEDVRFYKHNGIDTKSLLRVLLKSIIFNDPSSGGGSTITQQLAKNMFGRHDYGRFTLLINKTKEILLARRIEKVFTKEEILTLYLNTVSFGENLFGIEAAAGRYFNKNVSSLKIEESAVLIGILKANTYFNPRINPGNSIGRRNVILSQMEKYGFLQKTETDSLVKLPLSLDYVNYELEGPADYFLVQVRNAARTILEELTTEVGEEWNLEEDGLIINTTLDLELQNYSTGAFREHLALMQKRLRDQYSNRYWKNELSGLTESELKRNNLTEKADLIKPQLIFDWKGSYSDSISVRDSLSIALTLLHAGLMAMDPLTGAVKSWVGGVDFRTQPYDQVLARRQIASTFKPILYTVALEAGVEPCSYLDNDSIVITGTDETWSPSNFDHTYGGEYSLQGALIHSMNIPSFNLFLSTDFAGIDSLWRKMGFAYPLFNHPSLPFGTAEANIREVAVAFSAFANGGYKISPYTIESITTHDGSIIWENKLKEHGERLISEKTSLIMSAILQRAINEGTGASVRGRYGVTLPLAGKTGTSQDYADAWFTAFNPGIVMVARVGASTPSVHFSEGSFGSGSALALPIIAITLQKLQENPGLRLELTDPFPDLPPDLQAALDCPVFREDNMIDRFIDFFNNDEVNIDKDSGRAERKKKSFFRRLFRRN